MKRVRGHPYHPDDYYAMNPDVVADVKAGQFKSGRHHFMKFGIAEGRPGCAPSRLGIDESFFGSERVDISNMDSFRAENFPYAGPHPWLDQPDWEEKLKGKLENGDITEEEAQGCRTWNRDGYLILKGCVDEAMIDRAWSAYEAAIERGEIVLPSDPISPEDPLPGRFIDTHRRIPEICDILRHKTILRWVKVLMDREPAPYQTLSAHKGTQQGAHSDSIHMTTYPIGYLTAAWVALEDIHPDSGPLFYYPGSHRLPYYFSKDVGIEKGDLLETGHKVYWERYEPFIAKLIEDHDLQPSTFTPNKGDVLIWHANLLHGGSKRKDVARSRRSLVCHYFVKGALNYHDLSGKPALASTATCTVADRKHHG